MQAEIIQKAIKVFAKFPTIGPRTASRFVFYLIKLPKGEFKEFLTTLINLKKTIKLCRFCFNPFDINKSEDKNLCSICQNKSRDLATLCIVENESDLNAIEQTKKYKGLYFILGGTVGRLKTEDIKKIRVKELMERISHPERFGIQNSGFKEIIIATDYTAEGQSTALFLIRKIKEIKLPKGKPIPKITRLGQGLPSGGELEYADEETIASAFENRK